MKERGETKEGKEKKREEGGKRTYFLAAPLHLLLSCQMAHRPKRQRSQHTQ